MNSDHPKRADNDLRKKIRANASTFHKNFSTGAFEKNGALVSENIYVNSNNTIVIGRENFVKRIERYKIPFPGLQMKDRIVLVERNIAAVHYILQGHQNGPYSKIPASGNKVEAMSAEFFVMNNDAVMTNLLTITQLDKLEAQSKGNEQITDFQPVSLLTVKNDGNLPGQVIKQAIEDYLGYFNARKWDHLAGMTADNVTINWNGNLKSGKQALLSELQSRLAGIPDLTYQIDRNVVEGDRAGIAYTMIGRQTSALNINGIVLAPGENTVAVREGQFFQFDDEGKIIDVITVSNANDFIKRI
jgi:predicted ester cyclase